MQTPFSLLLSMLLFVPTAFSAQPFKPTPLLFKEHSVALQGKPIAMELVEDRIVVAGEGVSGAGLLTVIDLKSLEIIGQFDLPFVPEDMVAADNGSVFLVGHAPGENTLVLVLNNELNEISDYALDSQLSYPVLSLPRQQILVVGSLSAPITLLDVSKQSAPLESTAFKVPEQSFGVGQLWGAVDESTVFINLTAEVALVAFDVKTAKRLDDISYRIKGGRVEPFTVVGFTGEPPCTGKSSASFLIADSRRGTLTLAEYDEYFRSLNIQAEVTTDIRTPANARELVPGESVTMPSGLVSSSCDQSLVWLGGRNFKHAVQYAVNSSYESIERIGFVALPAYPVDLLVDPEGSYALSLAESPASITRFSADEQSIDVSELGDPDVRRLQRMLTDSGYPVGSIDGIFGSATRRAVTLYEAKRGVKIDLDNLESIDTF